MNAKITFVCDREGCNNTKTMYKTQMKKSNKNYYCCRDCYTEARKTLNKKKITFTCEREGCDNKRTQYQYLYDRNKHHYCSKNCSSLGRFGKEYRTKHELKKIKRENSNVSQRIAMYFQSEYKSTIRV